MMTVETDSTMRHPDAAAISKSLEGVLRSPQFKDALQLQSLLKYIVENSIGGHDDALKERIIGMNVFGRKPDYETADDPIVRSRVGQLRRRLEQYYASAEAAESSVQILIPNGSYRPTFVLGQGTRGANKVIPPLDPPPPMAAAAAAKPPRETRWLIWGIAAVVAFSVFLAAWILIPRWGKTELDLFWGPLFEADKNVIIYTAPGLVYVPSASYQERFRATNSPDDMKLPMGKWELPVLTDGDVLTAKDLVIEKTAASGSGEVVACAKLAVLLTNHHRAFDMRSDSNLPFADIRNSPAVLLGGYNNFWTIETTRDLPFFLDRAARIRERGGQGRVWSIAYQPGVSPQEDYSLVTRHFDAKTGSPLISLSGITTCGTRAAADFVTDPAQLARLASIHRNALEHKNLEIVLHSTFVDCIPSSTDIIDVKYW